jgi:hypothetical protein
MILKFWKKKICGRARLPAAHDGPWPRVPPSAWRHHGGSFTARHLALALSTSRHLRSMRSPCRRRLHVCLAPLSLVAATPKPCSPPLPQLLPNCHPTLLSLPFASASATAVAVICEHRSSAITPRRHPQGKPSARVTERPTALAASSSMWGSSWIVTCDPPPVKQPTP